MPIKCCYDYWWWLNVWRDSFQSYCSNGTPTYFVSVGSGGQKTDPPYECESMHEHGRALDLTGANFTGHGYWWVANWGYDKKFTMGMEAGAHRLFRNVIGPFYDSNHGNHFHIDLTPPFTPGAPAFSAGSPSQVRFVQASLNYVWGLTVPIDNYDVHAPNHPAPAWTQQMRDYANGIAAYWGGASVPTNIETNQAHWAAYCRTTFTHGTV